MNIPRLEIGTIEMGKKRPFYFGRNRRIEKSDLQPVSPQHLLGGVGLIKFIINYSANNIVCLLATAIVRLFDENK